MSYDDTIADTETISTPVGDYTLTWHYDQDSESPLRDDDGMMFYIAGGRDVYAEYWDADENASGALSHYISEHGSQNADDITRRYEKWRAITGSPWQLFTGSGCGSMQSHWWNWFVLVLADTNHGYVDPEAAALAAMDEYERWAQGEVYGFVLDGPDGDTLESVWGFIGDEGRQYARYDVDATIKHDVEQRQKKASLVGAGFVGLI